jgi:hypothetical protein
MPHHCHQITSAASLHAQDAKAVLGIVEGDALDCAGQSLDRLSPVDLSGLHHLVHAPSEPELALPSCIASVDGPPAGRSLRMDHCSSFVL